MQPTSRIPFDGFIIGLMAVVVLSFLWPEGGAGTGPFALATLASYGISGIFFFYGLRLDRTKLYGGLSNYKLHILIQLCTFVVFPLLILPFKDLFADDLKLLWLGTFFLASLPSTVSSSVVMVSIAEGNIAAAIFNATVSGILGIFLTPLWMGAVVNIESVGIDLPVVFGKLFLQVLLPVIVGALLNKRLGYWADRNKARLKIFDQTVILVIVYTSFSQSFSQNLFAPIRIIDLAILAIAMLGLFFIVFLFIRRACRLLGFTYEDTIAALFCGSKKSLVHGTVMSNVMFSKTVLGGIILLPLMIYHFLQLISASVLANRILKSRRI